MSKSIFFTGQPVFTQLLALIDKRLIKALANRGKHDRYYKYFDTYTHLVTMLYCIFNKCTSSREVITGMKACQHKLSHLGMIKAPGKSTLCDANMNRSHEVFAAIYEGLYQQHRHFLPDSRLNTRVKKLFIADASVITLFQDIIRSSTQDIINGKIKGGLKVHTLINATEDVAAQITITDANANDMTFLQEINLSKGSFIVFDKGYVDYAQYERLDKEGVFFVTRLRRGAKYELMNSNIVTPKQQQTGVIEDKTIILGTRTHAKKVKLRCRVISYYDRQKDRTFEFVTNNFLLKAQRIADLYQKRWQIELLFKRVKQNFPLKYFLGDNENAVKTQIWCAFIADLLLKLVQNSLKRKWAFANLSSMIRLHLMSYINLFGFLNNPDKLPAIHFVSPQLAIEGLKIDFRT